MAGSRHRLICSEATRALSSAASPCLPAPPLNSLHTFRPSHYQAPLPSLLRLLLTTEGSPSGIHRLCHSHITSKATFHQSYFFLMCPVFSKSNWHSSFNEVGANVGCCDPGVLWWLLIIITFQWRFFCHLAQWFQMFRLIRGLKYDQRAQTLRL